MLEFVYEAEQHTVTMSVQIPCTVTMSVQSLGQGTRFVLAVLHTVFLNLSCLVFQNKSYLPL